MTPEGKLKKFLREECKRRGLHTFTLRAVGVRGWPDNCVTDNLGHVLWIELKTEEANLETKTAIRQKNRIRWLQNRGHDATMAVGKAGILKVFDLWTSDCDLEVVTK